MTPIDALKADMYRVQRRFSWGGAIALAARNRNFRVLFTLRMAQAGGLAGPLWRLAHRLATGSAGMDLPWAADLGAGIAIPHGWAIVVNAGARVGDNVTLFHGVTLGRKDSISVDGQRETGFPIIEDEVWIGPHAIIVGAVTVGRGSIIAGGALVTRDVPPRSIVMGNPGQVVKSDCVPDVMNPAPL
jgi:serine O-acetyltransferase